MRLKTPMLRWCGPALAWVAPLLAQSPANPAPIELPAYPVTDTRDLPPPEKWFYGKIVGFEILSNASERATKNLVRDFQKFSLALGRVWPGVQRPSSVPAMLVVCGRAEKFAAFVPDGERHPARAMASLSLRDREQSAIVIDFEAKGSNPSAPEGATAAAAAPTTDTEGNAIGGGDPGFAVDAYEQLCREYIHFLLAGVEPRAPTWLEEGLAQIFIAMEVTKTADTVGKPEESSTISVAQGSLNDTGRALIKMGDLFAVAHDSDTARNPLSGTWTKQCAAFVHWGLYGDQGRHQRAFLTFIARLAREPLTEAMFKECFRQSYDDMGATLRGYIDFTTRLIADVQSGKGEKLPEPPPFELREATESEVGRIKGDTLRLAKHPDAARLAIIAPYIHGERDPQLLAALGLLECQLGDAANAKKFLEAAAQAKAVRARAYVELARLRLADSLAQPAAPGGKLDAQQTASVLTALFTARSQPPPMPEVYELIADTWTHCAITPTAAHLGALDEGVRLFPRDVGLVYATAALKLRAGLVPEANTLIDLGLRIANDGAARTQFETLRASLPPAPTAPAAK